MDKKGKAAGIFAAGVLFGTAGIKLLSSKEAKKTYTKITASALRAKDSLMKNSCKHSGKCGGYLGRCKTDKQRIRRN